MAPLALDAAFARLPHIVVHLIFAFALSAPRERVSAELKQLACVSPEWNQSVRNLLASLALNTLVLVDVKIKSRQELLELRRRITLRRTLVCELQIEDSYHFSSDWGLRLSLDQWRAIAAQLPRLEELNLTCMSRDEPTRLATAVRAVKQQCPLLKAIVIPTLPSTRSGLPREPAEVTELLMHATLEGRSPELRHLRFPLAFKDMQKPHETATKYLNMICETAPNVEVLDGHSTFTTTTHEHTCPEQWFIDEATWVIFCNVIRNLKSFDWSVVPLRAHSSRFSGVLASSNSRNSCFPPL